MLNKCLDLIACISSLTSYVMALGVFGLSQLETGLDSALNFCNQPHR